MNSVISIIIPVYKAEKWISRCIESILNQSYADLDIIIIDDGSPDKSGVICDEYAVKDRRITVIHQENLGPSIARNKGLKRANGEYIQFVDSDDWLNEDACKLLVEGMESENVNQVVCGLNIIKNGKVLRTPHLPRKKYSIHKDPADFFELFKIFASPCNKLYKKNYITESFDSATSAGEDLIFNLHYLKNTDNILTISECLYNVSLDNENSLNRQFREDRLDIFLENQKKIFTFCNNIYGNNFKNEFLYNKSVLGVHSFYRDVCRMKNKENSIKIIKKYINNDDVVNAVFKARLERIDYRIFRILLRTKKIQMIYIFFKFKHLLEKIKR